MAVRIAILSLGVALALLLAGMVAFAGTLSTTVPAVAHAMTAFIRVNGAADNNVADDVLTLREAILLCHGTLGRVLSPQEQAQVTGNPVTAKFAHISLMVDVTVGSALPEITRNGVAIETPGSGRHVIDGGGKVAIGLVVRATRFDIANVEFRNFTEEGLHIETAGAQADHDFTIVGVKFSQGKTGLVVKEPAIQLHKGKMTFTLAENEFTNLSENGFTLSAGIPGTYDFRHNKLLNLAADVAAKINLGGGTGNITVTYDFNTHSTKNGTGSVFEEMQHTGKIKWEIDGNHWLGGQTGLRATFRVEGAKDFAGNEYTLNTKAGLVLKTVPFSGASLQVNLDADVLTHNGTGWNLDLHGQVELSTRLLTVLDNTVGVDGFVRLDAVGAWHDRHSTYKTNAEVGLRLFTVASASFELFYRFDFVDGNGRGFHFHGPHDSITIRDSTFVFNGTDGILLGDAHADIRTSLICFNQLDGIQINGDSNVTAITDIVDQNGPIDVRNLSPNDVDASLNDWGPITASEMNHKPYPSNISRIYDVFDDPTRGFVAYARWDDPGMGCSRVSPTPTSTETSSPTATPSPMIPTATPTATVTRTATATVTRTATATVTRTATPRATGTDTSTVTVTPTGTSTATLTPLPTVSDTPTGTDSPTVTSTATDTPTGT